MAKNKSGDVAAAIELLIDKESKTHRKTWIDTMPADVRADLDVIKARWKAGTYQVSLSAVCRAIAKITSDRVGKIPGKDTVRRWLEKD